MTIRPRESDPLRFAASEFCEVQVKIPPDRRPLMALGHKNVKHSDARIPTTGTAASQGFLGTAVCDQSPTDTNPVPVVV